MTLAQKGHGVTETQSEVISRRQKKCQAVRLADCEANVKNFTRNDSYVSSNYFCREN